MIRIAQLSCGSEYSGIQKEIERAAETVGAKFVYTWDEVTNSGELLSLTTMTGLKPVSTEKTIQSVKYYNATGQLVGKDAQGFIISKTTYIDGTQKIEKSIKFNR